MTLFERTLCVTMIAAVVLVFGFQVFRPASRSGPQAAAPIAASPVRPSSGRLPAGPTGTPDGSYPGIGPSGQPDLEVPATAASGVPPSQFPPAAAEVRVTTASARRVTGLASWYCRPPTSRCTRGYPASGLYAAAGATLRLGNWRGRYVYVNGLRVRLIDSCACGSRVIDLYASAFRRLAPLSRGVIRVTVTW